MVGRRFGSMRMVADVHSGPPRIKLLTLSHIALELKVHQVLLENRIQYKLWQGGALVLERIGTRTMLYLDLDLGFDLLGL